MLKYLSVRGFVVALTLCFLSSASDGQHLPVNAGRGDGGFSGEAPSAIVAPDANDAVSVAAVEPVSGDYQETPRPRPAPIIPEPMLFDLMRPLGAARGELEVNTLVRPPIGQRGQGVAWAPEIEFAFAPGHTVEIEIPFEGGHAEAFKFGLQGTLGTFRRRRSIHGWQALVERARRGKDLQLDALHLAGHRLGQHWSVLTMQGMRWHRTAAEPRSAVKGVFNPTVFREVSERLVLGLETNLAVGAKRRADWVVLPQAQVEWRRYSFLMGFGAQRAPDGRVRPTPAFRLVRTIGGGH